MLLEGVIGLIMAFNRGMGWVDWLAHIWPWEEAGNWEYWGDAYDGNRASWVGRCDGCNGWEYTIMFHRFFYFVQDLIHHSFTHHNLPHLHALRDIPKQNPISIKLPHRVWQTHPKTWSHHCICGSWVYDSCWGGWNFVHVFDDVLLLFTGSSGGVNLPLFAYLV